MLQEVSVGAGGDRLEAGRCTPLDQGCQPGHQLQVLVLEDAAQSFRQLAAAGALRAL